MAAIPTVYRGAQFRSRLEARWAAFFDLLGWSWDYEPVDLAGYIPDFFIQRLDLDPILVEVKGVTDIFDETRDEAIIKAQKSGWRGQMLYLGAGPLLEPIPPMFGSIYLVDDTGWPDGRHAICLYCPACRKFTTVGFYDRGICGCPSKDLLTQISAGQIKDAWLRAGSAVQWKSPRANA